jgi:hypothetical protein
MKEKYMAVKNGNILSKLDAKRVSLNTESKSNLDQAASLESQIAGLRTSAQLNGHQAEAIEQALAILNKAGVEV